MTTESDAAGHGASSPGSAGHIFLVEDDALIREHLENLLDDLGYKVTSARNAPECLRALPGLESVDLLLSDIVMPGGMSGIELASEVRKIKPGLPILFSSGHVADVIGSLGVTDSRIAFLRKPYRRADLCRALAALLE